jgi:hypothetical protein
MGPFTTPPPYDDQRDSKNLGEVIAPSRDTEKYLLTNTATIFA